MTLADFINRHAGQTAWLFGKGPSLSDFDFKTAGPLRVAINDVIAHVPACVYGFANDGVARWAELYKPGQILFQPLRCLGEYDSTAPGAVACEVVTYDDTCNDVRLCLPPDELAQQLTIRKGTLGSALQILHIMGVREVYMVGIDGGGTHAPGYEWRTRLRHDHAGDYNSIRSAAITAAELMGIKLTFHNTPKDMQPNGKVLVRMLKNCMAQAAPYAVGEIASFPPDIADELIQLRCAEPFTPPEKAEVETAEASMPEKETADIPTPKSRKPRK
jgi:hypothetical protein